MNKKNNVSKNFWELPELIEINRLPMAAELMNRIRDISNKEGNKDDRAAS